MVNEIINELLSKVELKKLPALFHTLTIKNNITKAQNTKSTKTHRPHYYKQI